MANGENRQKKNELIANEWTTVRSLWDACKGNVTDSKVREEIEGLLSKERKWSSEAEDWYALNLAKQQVGAHLSPIQVDAEFQGLLDVARDRSVPCLARFQELKASLFSKPTPEGVTSDQQRAAYLSLLQKAAVGFCRNALPTATSPGGGNPPLPLRCDRILPGARAARGFFDDSPMVRATSHGRGSPTFFHRAGNRADVSCCVWSARRLFQPRYVVPVQSPNRPLRRRHELIPPANAPA